MTAGKKLPPTPPTPPARKRRKQETDFDAPRVTDQFGDTGSENRSASIPGGQFGTDAKPRSVFNRIAESGMNFVRNVLDNPTRHDMPVLDLKGSTGQLKAGTGEFETTEASEIHEYRPTWEGGQQQPPQFGGAQQEKDFTKFQSAIRQWNAKEAEKAFERPKRKRQNVVFQPEKRRSGWRWIVLIMIIGGLGVGGLYTYRFVNEKLITDFKAKVNKKKSSAEFDEQDIVEEEEPRKKRRYNKRKRRRRP